MHIVYICSELPPATAGGVGTFVATIGRALVARGHRVTVVGSYGRPYEWATDGPSVVDVLRPAPQSRLSRLIKRAQAAFSVPRRQTLPTAPSRIREAIARLHRNAPIDIVEWHSNQGQFFDRVRGTVDVVRLHGLHILDARSGGELPAGADDCERRTLTGVRNWIGVSQWMLEAAKTVGAAAPLRETVVYNPVDDRLFRPGNGVAQGIAVLYAGTLCERKGDLRLARAANQVLRDFPDVRFVYAGRDTGERREKVTHCVSPVYRERLLFAGPLPQSELARLMANSALVVLPSSWESFGLVYAEAMVAGVPVVAQRAAAVPEIVSEGLTGLLVEQDDVDGLAYAISTLLGDHQLRLKMGRNARAYARERYSLDACVSGSLGFYHECLAA